MHLAENGAYKLQGFQGCQGVPMTTEHTNRPALNEEAFKLTCPRANGELPLREAEYQKMNAMLCSVPTLLQVFQKKVNAHNLAKNKSGVTFKAGKRIAPEDVADRETEPVVFLPVLHVSSV